MPSLSVCLLLDDAADRAVRRLWRQLADDGVPSLATYTHGPHVPHLTLASLGPSGVAVVRDVLAPVQPEQPVPLRFQALGAFTRSRCSLVPVVSPGLLVAQELVVGALRSAGLVVQRHYLPGDWLPHLSLTPRIPVEMLPGVAQRVYDVLPLTATALRTVVVDTGTGHVHPLDPSR
jgi:2'-5' RNA ligase